MDSPVRVVERAASHQLAAIAITDHDTTSGVAEARQACRERGLEFLSGVEISSMQNGMEVHIVGLGIDAASTSLTQALDFQKQQRIERADAILGRLHDLGIEIQKDAVVARTASGVVGRMHIAHELVAVGAVLTPQEAFNRYLGSGKKAYVRKPAMSCERAIELIREAGGLAFLAHPGIGNMPKRLESLLRLPFDGIEAFHVHHSREQTESFIRIAQERGLLISGGSDCHGAAKSDQPEMGKVLVPFEYFARIRDAISDSRAEVAKAK